MYYYALIDSTTGVCYDMVESETQVIDNPYWIQVNSIDKSYIVRKKYVNGVWLDSTPAEAQNAEARTIGIGDEWLDTKIYNIANEVDGKANYQSPLCT